MPTLDQNRGTEYNSHLNKEAGFDNAESQIRIEGQQSSETAKLAKSGAPTAAEVEAAKRVIEAAAIGSKPEASADESALIEMFGGKDSNEALEKIVNDGDVTESGKAKKLTDFLNLLNDRETKQ